MEKIIMTHDEVLQLLREGYDMPRGWYKGKGQPKWHQLVYDKWRNMWMRCYDPNHPQHPLYKDVIISDEFKIFCRCGNENFTSDIEEMKNLLLLTLS